MKKTFWAIGLVAFLLLAYYLFGGILGLTFLHRTDLKTKEAAVGTLSQDILNDCLVKDAIKYHYWSPDNFPLAFSKDGREFRCLSEDERKLLYDTFKKGHNLESLTNILNLEKWSVNYIIKDSEKKYCVENNSHNLCRVPTEKRNFGIGTPAQWRVELDGKEIDIYNVRAFSYYNIHDMTVTPDGDFAYIVRDAYNYYVVVNGLNTKMFNYIDNLHFDSESNLVYFNALGKNKEEVLLVSVDIQNKK